MHIALIIMLFVVGAIVGLALLIVLLGALAALYARARRGKEMNALDGVMTGVLFAAGMVLNVVVATVCLGWDRLIGRTRRDVRP